MARALALLVVFLACPLLLAGLAAGYGERPFNANETVSGTSFPVESLLGFESRVAQSFSPSEPFVLKNVTLYVANVGLSQTDVLNVTIQGGTSAPDGTILALSLRSRGGEGWLDFPLTPQPALAAATYWIVARSTQPTSEGYRWFHSNADVVSGEALQQSGGGPWSPTGIDMAYVTYGLLLEPSISVGMSADRRSAAPNEAVVFTVHLNNSGSRAAPIAWVNLTLDADLAFLSDTAGSLNGVRNGNGTRWTISLLGNGVHAFTVVAVVGPSAVGGATLSVAGRLNYTDSSGGLRPGSSASASVIVSLKTKPMYLHYDGVPNGADDLRAAPPAGPLVDTDSDGNPGMTLGAAAKTWTLTPALAKPLRLRGEVTASLFLNAANPSDSGRFNFTLVDRRGAVTTPVASLDADITVDNNPGSFQIISLDFGAFFHWINAGNATELRLSKTSGADLWLAYYVDAPSEISVTTDTFISIDEAGTNDDRGPASIFSGKDNVYVRANTSDPFGSAEIASVTIDLTGPTGSPVATGMPLTVTATDGASPSAWKRFAYLLATPVDQGSYSFLLTATEGNGVVSTATGTFTVRYPDLAFAVAPDTPLGRPNGLVRFTVSFDNDGLGSGPAWINATVPPTLAYLSDNASANGGVKTGDFNWSFANVPPGPRSFEITLRVAAGAADGTVQTQFDLAYGDEKGFVWFGPSKILDLEIDVPPGAGSNPFLLLLFGGVLVAAPFAGYVVWRARRPAIEEAFLIHRDGILLYHLSRSIGGEGEKDRDILGAMLTAVQDFVKDSFKYGENRDLNKLEFGDYRVLIERGKHIFLAVVLSTETGEAEIRRKVRQVINEAEAKFGSELGDWSGDMDRLLGLRDIVKRLVGRE